MIARKVIDFLLEASSEELYQKYYKDIPINIYKKIVSNDPTSTDRKNGKYVKWLLDLYKIDKNKNIFLEDLYKIKESLVLFNKYGNRAQKNQIQMYKDYKELIIAMETFEKVEQEENIEKNKLKDIKENQTDKVYEDNEWLVVVPKTKESSCFWGMGTKWCTAAKKDKNNKFDDYNKKGPLYVLISKIYKDNNGRQKKYQFHFETAQYMDVLDKSISKEDYNIFNNNLKKYLLSLITRPDTAFKWAKEFGDREEMKDIVIKSNNSEYAFKWAKEFGDIEEMKHAIIKSNNSEYAIKWVKEFGDREEMKDIVIKSNNSEYAFKWAKEFGDKEEMKDLVIRSNNDDIAYYWARDIGDKEEMKEIILNNNNNNNNNNASSAYLWAKEFGDKEEMKEIVLNSNDSYHAYLWGKHIGDKEEMKEIVLNSNDSYHAYLWAKEIGNKEEMKEIVLNGNDPYIACDWAKHIGNKDEMKKVVNKYGNSTYKRIFKNIKTI